MLTRLPVLSAGDGYERPEHPVASWMSTEAGSCHLREIFKRNFLQAWPKNDSRNANNFPRTAYLHKILLAKT